MTLLASAAPLQQAAVPGTAAVLSVSVTNTRDIIGGYRIRVLGCDPEWVHLSAETLSLFPGDTGSCTVSVTLPDGLPAGAQPLTVHVSELTEPAASALLPVRLDVAPVTDLDLRLEPLTVTAGRSGTFSLVARNTGNTRLDVPLHGSDEEGQVRFVFDPPRLAVAPGDSSVVQVRTTARRRFVGSPLVRTLVLGAGDPARPVGRQARGTLLQRPVVSRSAVSLLGLLAAVTVFAVVVTAVLSHVVGTSSANRDLALQVAQGQQVSRTTTGRSAVSGTVQLLTARTGVAGVTVDLFTVADTSTPVTSAATGADGTYAFTSLPQGGYKVRFRGAGFAELWYPQGLTAADATTVELQPGRSTAGIDVQLGGLPASLSGTVTGDDVRGAVVTLQVPTAGGTTLPPAVVDGSGTTVNVVQRLVTAGADASPQVADTTPASGFIDLLRDQQPAAGPGAPAPPDPRVAGAVLQSVVVGDGGAFALMLIPSPAVYQLVVRKPGYATNVQTLDLTGGEARKGVVIRLRKGDGLVSGHVLGPDGPVSGAVVSATDGQDTAQTVSSGPGAGAGDRGAYTLRNLPTPANLVLTVAATGLASQTIAISLSDAEQLGGVDVTLSGDAATLTGNVAVAPAYSVDAAGRATGVPDGVFSVPASADGVTVTVTNGTLTLQTVTSTVAGRPGSWTVSGLAVPGSYVITFTRDDLTSQTVSESLDVTATATVTTVPPVQLAPATASVVGVAYEALPAGQPDSAAARRSRGVASVGITLTVGTAAPGTAASGTQTYQVATSSAPDGPGEPVTGTYEIDRLPPGTYTITYNRPGARASSQTVTLGPGQRQQVDVALPPAATVTAVVQDATGACSSGGEQAPPTPCAGYQVRVFVAVQYPTTSTAAGRTGTAGSVTFPGLGAPETYVVDVAYPPGSQPSTSVTLTLGPSDSCIVTDTMTRNGSTVTVRATPGATCRAAGTSTTAPTSPTPASPTPASPTPASPSPSPSPSPPRSPSPSAATPSSRAPSPRPSAVPS